jgi:hypothetical protein
LASIGRNKLLAAVRRFSIVETGTTGASITGAAVSAPLSLAVSGKRSVVRYRGTPNSSPATDLVSSSTIFIKIICTASHTAHGPAQLPAGQCPKVSPSLIGQSLLLNTRGGDESAFAKLVFGGTKERHTLLHFGRINLDKVRRLLADDAALREAAAGIAHVGGYRRSRHCWPVIGGCCSRVSTR